MKLFEAILGTATVIVGFPVMVIGATAEALSSNKTFSEAFDDAIPQYDEAIEEACEFGRKNNHELIHGAGHVIKHIVKGRS